MIKILFLAANPFDTDQLRLDEEVRIIDEALRRSEFRDQFVLISHWAVRIEELQELLLRHRPDIVHFSGHGSSNSEIILQTADGEAVAVPPEALSDLFRIFRHEVRCVVLNACYSEAQAANIAQHIDCVIGMPDLITETASHAFASAFYRAIGYGSAIHRAFELGCSQVDLSNLRQEHKPVLIAPRADPRNIFLLDKDTLKIPSEERRFPTAQTLSREEARDRRNRHEMLERVRTFWIDTVYEQSLYDEVRIHLGMERRSDLVDSRPWNLMVIENDLNAPTSLRKPRIVDVFESIHQYLLILGEPGSGKTMTLLELAQSFLDCAEQDTTHPIPVVFNLSSWSQHRAPLSDWLLDELNTRYRIPKPVGQSWLENDELLLLLDSLDEVREIHREECVETINQFIMNHMMPVVVCCRSAEHQSLTNSLHLNSAVVLQPLTPEQIEEYLIRAGANVDLSGLRMALKQDSELQNIATSPLMLNIMTLAFYGVSAAELTKTGPSQTYHQHVFNAYIVRMFMHKLNEDGYSVRNTLRWLRWLAERLVAFTQATFFIDRMQPNWVSTIEHKWSSTSRFMLLWSPLYALATGIVGGLIISLVDGLRNGILYGLNTGIGIGWVAGLADAVSGSFRRIDTASNLTSFWSKIRSGLFYGIYWGLIFGMTGGLWEAWRSGLSAGFTGALITGINGGVIGVLAARVRQYKLRQSPKWTWLSLKRDLLLGLGIGSIFAVSVGLSTGYTVVMDNVHIYGYSPVVMLTIALIFTTYFGIPAGLVGGLFGGIISAAIFEPEVNLDVPDTLETTTPNYGIRVAARYSIAIGLSFWILVGIVFGTPVGLTEGVRAGVSEGLRVGFGVGVAGGILGGGATVTKHLLLRCRLWLNGYTPLNYTRFQ